MQAVRSVTSDISSLLHNPEQFSAAFDEEANFCAGATQVHTHSPTCVKYSLGKQRGKGDLCRFKAPWKLVENTAFTPDGVLQIRRTHPMVNRWNKAIAVGLRHNHDISFIATQRKTMALVYYVTNYATKVEDPVWKRVAAAAELLVVSTEERTAQAGREGSRDNATEDAAKENRTRQFLMRVANRVFTERPLSQVEVIADLLGYPAEFTDSSAWAYLNTSLVYWHVFRRWRHLRQESGAAGTDDALDDSVVVEEAGLRISHVEAYQHRGEVMRGLCLYDYISLIRLKRISDDESGGAWGEVPFEDGWAPGNGWVQVVRRPGKQATVCLDGYLSKDFAEDDEESCHRRYVLGTARRHHRNWRGSNTTARAEQGSRAASRTVRAVGVLPVRRNGRHRQHLGAGARGASPKDIKPRRQRAAASTIRRRRKTRCQTMGSVIRRRRPHSRTRRRGRDRRGGRRLGSEVSVK